MCEALIAQLQVLLGKHKWGHPVSREEIGNLIASVLSSLSEKDLSSIASRAAIAKEIATALADMTPGSCYIKRSEYEIWLQYLEKEFVKEIKSSHAKPSQRAASPKQDAPSRFTAQLNDLLQTEDSRPLYETFFDICKGLLPPDADIRYQWLRENAYVVRDEDDINVYVAKVARRHAPKFKWLYDNLFAQYQNVFQGEIDLVVWGCGCGLDLLALYDRAMQQNIPQLWLTVRSVTLLDISEVALDRARTIAETLFPCARGRITSNVCNFKKPESIKVTILKSFIYTPRLHLLSNVVDLLSQEQLGLFVSKLKTVLSRRSSNRNFYNEMFVAFSPEYRNQDWGTTKGKIEAFRQSWGGLATPIEVSGNEPEMCAYAAFHVNSLVNSEVYKLYASGNRCLRNLVRGRNKLIDAGCDDSRLRYLYQNLLQIKIGDKNFFECYEWADIQMYDDGHGNVADRILFVPPRGRQMAACVVCLGKQLPNPNKKPDFKNKAWKELKCVDLDEESVKRFASQTKQVFWNPDKKEFSGDTDYDKYRLVPTMDFYEAFVIDPKNAEPLPDIETKMDKRQRSIIYGRQQLRRIRGGAGCGKTTTMLWHGIMSILRTHQPVLLACRTVTLFSHNQRRMAASLLAQIPGLEYVERELIQFSTIDKYLCDHFKDIGRCVVKNCGWCKRRNAESRRNGNNNAVCVPNACGKGQGPIPDCEVQRKQGNSTDIISSNLSDEEKAKLCEVCKNKGIEGLCAREEKYLKSSDVFGAVMVDEIQSIEPEMVQALFNLTEAGNPQREFYAFCDERQSLKAEALETDSEVRKLRVKTPRTAGGSRRFNATWLTLKTPYRQIGEMSGVLTEVAQEFQRLMDSKYGDNETEKKPFQPGLADVFSVEPISRATIGSTVKPKVEWFARLGVKRITVVCDMPETVRELLASNAVNWNSTYSRTQSFREEQKLRKDFTESDDCIGLTTIELAQGWDLENVILVITKAFGESRNLLESVGTGITRAKSQLRILDASSDHWVYEHLKRYNRS
jgi:hypothetical protein